MIDENKRAYKDVGFYILYFRKKRELTQRQLADLIDVNYETISRIENANTGLSLDMLLKISKALDISLSELFAHAKL